MREYTIELLSTVSITVLSDSFEESMLQINKIIDSNLQDDRKIHITLPIGWNILRLSMAPIARESIVSISSRTVNEVPF